MYPTLFKIGPITIYSYGVLVSLAFFVAGYLIARDSARYGIPKDKIWDLLLAILISGIVGARVLHVLLNFKSYRDAPLEILMLHKGGLAIHGGIIAAIFVGILFLLKANLPVWNAGDLIMQYLPLGQAIGRIGCFLNGCCYGRPDASGLRYPTQLYSSIALLIIFVVLRYLSGRKRDFEGGIFLLYLLLYSPLRFFIDFLRGDLSPGLFGLTTSQLISAALFVIALSLYFFKARARTLK